MKFIQFLKDYWYIPLFILGVILGWLLFRKRGTPIEQTKAELEAIRAGTRAREMEEKWGTQQAKEALKNEHAKTLEKMDEEQKEEARRLENDPAALAKFLVRAGRK